MSQKDSKPAPQICWNTATIWFFLKESKTSAACLLVIIKFQSVVLFWHSGYMKHRLHCQDKQAHLSPPPS
jgi:hypothetical protein